MQHCMQGYLIWLKVPGDSWVGILKASFADFCYVHKRMLSKNHDVQDNTCTQFHCKWKKHNKLEIHDTNCHASQSIPDCSQQFISLALLIAYVVDQRAHWRACREVDIQDQAKVMYMYVSQGQGTTWAEDICKSTIVAAATAKKHFWCCVSWSPNALGIHCTHGRAFWHTARSALNQLASLF